MPKRLRDKNGFRRLKGKVIKITRDTFVKNPRKGKKLIGVKAREKKVAKKKKK